jgi:hypothetical protein
MKNIHAGHVNGLANFDDASRTPKHGQGVKEGLPFLACPQVAESASFLSSDKDQCGCDNGMTELINEIKTKSKHQGAGR